MDCALSPVQQRNLEKAWGAKVIDRTGLILEIFGRRASTREGTLQVEHAHLAYQKSPARAVLDPPGAPARRLRLPGRPRRDPDRGRPAHDPGAHDPDRARPRRGASAPAACTGRAGRGCRTRSWRWSATPTPASRRLFNAPDPGRGHGQGHAVRHPRPHRPGDQAAARRDRDPVRHGGLHLRPADRADRGLPGDPGGRRSRPTCCSTCATSPTSIPRPRPRMSARCCASSASRPAADRIIEVWNKADLLDDDERTRLLNLSGQAKTRNDRDSAAPVLVSALTGEGLAALTAPDRGADRAQPRELRGGAAAGGRGGAELALRERRDPRPPRRRPTAPCTSRSGSPPRRSRASSTASRRPGASAGAADGRGRRRQPAAARPAGRAGAGRAPGGSADRTTRRCCGPCRRAAACACSACAIVIVLVLLMAAQAYDGSLHALSHWFILGLYGLGTVWFGLGRAGRRPVRRGLRLGRDRCSMPGSPSTSSSSTCWPGAGPASAPTR